MRLVIAVIFLCVSASAAGAQKNLPGPIWPGGNPPPAPAPSTIAPRPPNEFASPVAPVPTVPPRQVDDAMQTICPPGQSCAPGSPAR